MQYIGHMLFIIPVPCCQTQRRQQLEGRGVRGTSQKTAKNASNRGSYMSGVVLGTAFGYGIWSFIFYFMLSLYARSLLLIPRRGYDVMTGVKAHMNPDSEKGKSILSGCNWAGFMIASHVQM